MQSSNDWKKARCSDKPFSTAWAEMTSTICFFSPSSISVSSLLVPSLASKMASLTFSLCNCAYFWIKIPKNPKKVAQLSRVTKKILAQLSSVLFHRKLLISNLAQLSRELNYPEAQLSRVNCTLCFKITLDSVTWGLTTLWNVLYYETLVLRFIPKGCFC